MFKRNRKRVLALGTVAVLVVAGAAYAYFTTTGSGSGTATTGSTAAVTINGAASTTLYPGTTSPVSFTVDNPSPGTQRVGTIHLSGVTFDTGHATCSAGDYTMPDVVENQSVVSGNGIALTVGGTVTMAAQPTVSQDACQGATVTLHFTSN